MLPLLLLLLLDCCWCCLPHLRVHFRFMWQSAPQGFIVLVQIGLGLLPMAAAEQTLSDQQLLRAVSAPHFLSSSPSPLCLVEAIKLHFEAAQKFA